MRATVITSCVAVLFTSLPAAAGETDPPLIHVTGQAEVKVVPDEVVVTLDVSCRDKLLQNAKKENDERTGKVLALAKELDIKPKHVQTSYLTIQPLYEDRYSGGDPDRLRGYTVDKTIVFTLKDTSQLEILVSRALEAGANEVEGIDFKTTELRKHKDKARLMAIRAAREKATALAAELGMAIGNAYRIQEVDTDGWGGLAGSNAQVLFLDGEDSTSGPTFALGQIKIIARINVAFRLIERSQ